MNLILLLILCDLISITAQVCLKLGVGKTGNALLALATAWRAILQPLIWAGAMLYAAGTVLWVRALTMADLSFAYPFAALAYAGGVLASQWLLKERVSRMRWAGLGVIILGVLFVASSGAVTTR